MGGGQDLQCDASPRLFRVGGESGPILARDRSALNPSPDSLCPDVFRRKAQRRGDSGRAAEAIDDSGDVHVSKAITSAAPRQHTLCCRQTYKAIMAKTLPDRGMADRLKQARSKVFSSASAAAEALGMHANTVRAHENGQNGVGYDDLVRYCRRYGVNLEWLIVGVGPEAAQLSYGDLTPASAFQVIGTVQDGAWHPMEADDAFYGPVIEYRVGIPDTVEYSDDRFPPEVIRAIRVKTDWPGSIYLDGTILFVVESLYVEYRDRDHVIVVRNKNGFGEVSVRELSVINKAAPISEENVVLKALTSAAVDIPGIEQSVEWELEPIAVVVGALTKRPVPGMSIDARREFERIQRQERSQR